MSKLLTSVNDTTPTVKRSSWASPSFCLAQKCRAGLGFSGTMNFSTSQVHIPRMFAILACAASFGSLGWIVGLLARIAAFGIAVNMMVAILMVHFADGPFTNCLANQKSQGYEYRLLALALAIPIMIRGDGAFSVFGALAAKGQGI